jgi:hypothetical protein
MKKLLRMRELTLSKCIDTCRSEEITEMQMKSMGETFNDYANKIKTQRRRKYKESESDGSEDDERKTKSVEKKISCKFWGKTSLGKNLQQVQMKESFCQEMSKVRHLLHRK